MKILVVDDIEANVYQLQVLLGASGYTVETAPNGAVALAHARLSPPDLIITDILMPVMDGYSLCREWMRDEHLQKIPFVFYTATYVDEKDREFGLNLGAARFIVKPEEPENLLRMVTTLIAAKECGTPTNPPSPIQEEVVYLKGYSESLVRKLEDKNRDLEQLNRQLERDLADRKVAERQLREQNEVLSNAHEGVMIVDLSNRVTFWNRAAEELFGWPAAEAVGRSPEQLLGIDDPASMARLRAAVDQDGFWQGELQTKTRENRKLVVEARITLVKDEAGQPRARLNYLSDITEKKLLEEKFLHAQRLESIGMLAAGIAHDLNNILAPIVFAAPLLRESLSDPQDLKILNMLEQSAGRGSRLVKQILGFTHTAAGDFEAMQVRYLIRDVISVAEHTFPKAIQVEHRVPGELWTVRGNATQLHQVILNLCVNARDAMPQGGKLTLTASNCRLDAAQAETIPDARPGAWLVLEVSDTGTGIAPEIRDHIWQPFFTTKSAGQGTGLGLSTVRGIVAGHHGFIELRTEVGRGTTFRVFLPALETEAPQYSSASPFTGTEGNGELIVVVDDDPAIRAVISAILGRNGYRVVTCGDGVEAVAVCALRGSDVALVVTDVDMPRLGGVALARTLLHERPDLRVLAISGLARNVVSDPEASPGIAHAFLLKPFKPGDLLGAVHRLLHAVEKPTPSVN